MHAVKFSSASIKLRHTLRLLSKLLPFKWPAIARPAAAVQRCRKRWYGSMQLELRLLGGFEARRGASVISGWQRAGAKRLLKMLAAAPSRSLTVAHVASTFWQHDLGDRVGQRLHHLVYLLNVALAPAPEASSHWVDVRDGLIRLHGGKQLWIDVHHFESQLQQALARPDDAARKLHMALALYTGPLLPGDTADAVFNERRDQLQQQALSGLKALARVQQEGGAIGDAVVTLNQAIALAPSDESAHGKLMQLYAALGQRDQVERQYATCKAALALDLGVLPSAQTHQTYRNAMLHDGGKQVDSEPPTDTPTRWIPPTPLVSLIDRASLLRDIKLTLASESTRLVTLLGPGGMGKTQLSLRIAHELAPFWQHGACFVSMADVGPDEVLDCLARALRCSDAATRDTAAAITDHLRDKQLLLVLDNCEHVVQSLGWLTPLLSQAPTIKVLATSRRPLNLMGERVLAVPPLKPTVASAAKLFIERARAVSPSFKLDANTRNDVLAITQRLGGVPLSIELVAARAHTHAPSALREALESNLAATVAGGGPDRPERHQSLEQSLAWSYRLLQPQDQRVLHLAALFRAPFEPKALEATCHNTTPDFAVALQSLHELGFLAKAPTPDKSTPMRLHIPAGALDFLRRRDEHQSHISSTERLAYARWFADRAAQLDANMQGPGAGLAMAGFELEHDNCLVALEMASDQANAELTCRLVHSLSRYWSHVGAWTRADAWITRACDLAPQQTANECLDVLARAASYWFESQRFERARDTAARAVHTAKACGDIAAQCRITSLGAAASYHLGQTQTAIEQLKDVCQVAGAAGLHDTYNVAQNNLGNCYLTVGELARAASIFLACDAVHDNATTQARTSVMMNLAVASHYRGRSKQALDLAAKALTMEQSALPRPARLALVWARTSWMWCCQGDAAQAEQALLQAQAIAQGAQLRAWQRICAAQHGKILLVKGQAHQAEAVLARSVPACQNITDPWDVLDISIWLLWAQLQTPDGTARAQATLKRIVEDYGQSWCHEHPRIMEAAAVWLVTQKAFDAAATTWCAAQALRQDQGSKRFMIEQPQARKTQAALRATLGRDWQSTFATRGRASIKVKNLAWLHAWVA